MPRNSETTKETAPASPLRRSTRILATSIVPNDPPPAAAPARRATRSSSTSNEPTAEPAKTVKGRRSSLSQESTTSEESLPAKKPSLRTSVLRRSVSKSPETLQKEKVANGIPARTTRRSTRGRSGSPTDSNAESVTEELPAGNIGKKQRPSITEKIKPLDKIEEVDTEPKRTTRRSLRSNSKSPETKQTMAKKKLDDVITEVIMEEDEATEEKEMKPITLDSPGTKSESPRLTQESSESEIDENTKKIYNAMLKTSENEEEVIKLSPTDKLSSNSTLKEEETKQMKDSSPNKERKSLNKNDSPSKTCVVVLSKLENGSQSPNKIKTPEKESVEKDTGELLIKESPTKQENNKSGHNEKLDELDEEKNHEKTSRRSILNETDKGNLEEPMDVNEITQTTKPADVEEEDTFQLQLQDESEPEMEKAHEEIAKENPKKEFTLSQDDLKKITPKKPTKEENFSRKSLNGSAKKPVVKTNGVDDSESDVEEDTNAQVTIGKVTPGEQTEANSPKKSLIGSAKIPVVNIEVLESDSSDVEDVTNTRETHEKVTPKTQKENEISPKGGQIESAKKLIKNIDLCESDSSDAEDIINTQEEPEKKSPKKSQIETDAVRTDNKIETVDFSGTKEVTVPKETPIKRDNSPSKETQNKSPKMNTDATARTDQVGTPTKDVNESPKKRNSTSMSAKIPTPKLDSKLKREDISPKKKTIENPTEAKSDAKINGGSTKKLSSNIDMKLNKLIESYNEERSAKEQSNSSDDNEVGFSSDDDGPSDSEAANSFIDDLAEEVSDEDTDVSIGSNDIIDDGESVGSSEGSVDSNDTYENDSFVADDDYQEENLLEGDEYDLDDINAAKQKKKKSRIIKIADSSDEELDKMSTKPYMGLSPPPALDIETANDDNDSDDEESVEFVSVDAEQFDPDEGVKIVEIIEPESPEEIMSRSVIVTESPTRSVTIALEEAVDLNAIKNKEKMDISKSLLSPVVDMLSKSFEKADNVGKCKMSLKMSLEYTESIEEASADNNSAKKKKRSTADDYVSLKKTKQSDDLEENDEADIVEISSDDVNKVPLITEVSNTKEKNSTSSKKRKLSSVSIVEIEENNSLANISIEKGDKLMKKRPSETPSFNDLVVESMAETVKENSAKKGKKKKRKSSITSQQTDNATVEDKSADTSEEEKTETANERKLRASTEQILTEDSTRLSAKKKRRKRQRSSENALVSHLTFGSDDECDNIPDNSVVQSLIEKKENVKTKEKSSSCSSGNTSNEESKIKYLPKNLLELVESTEEVLKQKPKKKRKMDPAVLVPGSSGSSFWKCESIAVKSEKKGQKISPSKNKTLKLSTTGTTVSLREQLIGANVKRMSTKTLLKIQQKRKF